MIRLPVHRSFARALPALLLVGVLAAPLVAAPAEARVGGGFSFGSRGARTFSMPAPTPTAPHYAQPFQRTETPTAAPIGRPRFGFGSGLLAGLLGAGLMGSLFGGGFFAGIAALIGLLIKLALLGGAILLLLRLFRGRASAPVMAGGGPGGSARPSPLPGAPPTGAAGAVAIGPVDYAAFEAALLAVQEAHSREDEAALARLVTPEMARHLADQRASDRARGLRNDVSQVRLLRGDLAEAWREGGVSYATVAMRFAAVDVMMDRRSGAIASGDPVHPVETVELWTFRRAGTDGWRLSAIQQAG